MHISQITAYHVRIPLLKTVKHASFTRKDTDSIIVRCQLEDGTVGWGEGLPREYVTGETIDSAMTLLREVNWQKPLAGKIENIEDVIDRCNQIQLAPVGTGHRDCFGNSARCALEIAILDAITRACEKPISSLFDYVEGVSSIREDFEKVQYSAVITPCGTIREIYRALKYRYYKFRHCKVKVGVPGVSDTNSLSRIRRVLGKKCDIRIDANESWNSDDFVKKHDALKQYGISSIEQPVPHEDVSCLTEIRKQISTPVMLDESLCSFSDAENSIENQTCDLFNIRLSKCGGIIPSLKIAVLANQNGLGYQMGCQVGETGILSAAGRHFACSIKNICYREGSYDRFLVRERLTEEDLTFGYRGMAPALKGPGLGVTIDEESLSRVVQSQESWKINP